jgi:hypothetical protein
VVSVASNYVRDIEIYEDAAGRSPVADELVSIRRSDVRGYRTIVKKMELLRQQSLRDALGSGLIKKPSATIYVLRVQSGSSVAYRLSFFEPLCRGGTLIVFTECASRRDLRGDEYSDLVDRAERMRTDWIQRNCKEG